MMQFRAGLLRHAHTLKFWLAAKLNRRGAVLGGAETRNANELQPCSKPLFVFCLLLCACCSSTQARISSANDALNRLTDVIDPAYETARLDCNHVEEVLVSLGFAHELSGQLLFEKLHENRLRCNAIFAKFEEMISVQAASRAALDKGDVETGEEKLKELRALWETRP